MRSKSLPVFSLLVCAVFLGSCSGMKQPCTSNCGGGNSTVLVTLTAAPLTPPANTNLLSFSVTIAGISLTPSAGGTAVNIPLNNSTYTADLTRLQSDSAFVGVSTAVPAGNYSNMTVSLSNPLVTYCTQTQGAAGCTAGTVATVTGGAAAPQITSSPFPLSLTSGQTQGLAVNINLQNAISISQTQAQVVTAVNLGATGVVNASTLPPSASNLITGELSFIEDVTGVVTAVSTSTSAITVKSATRGSFTATANSSTVFSPNCTTFTIACAVVGQVASLDMVLNTDGTFTLLEFDPLDTTTHDWIEGIVTATPTTPSVLQIVTNDLVLATTNSVIGTALPLGSPVNVTLVNPQPFAVDNKQNLVIPNTFAGKTDATILQPGQTVAVRVTAFTAASNPAFAAANADFLYLRFTRVTGTVSSTAPPNAFGIQSLPPFFALTSAVTVQLSSATPATNFDGVGGASSLTISQNVSITALYFGPPTGPTPSPTPFFAAKVRGR